jgi:hypothetical protein
MENFSEYKEDREILSGCVVFVYKSNCQNKRSKNIEGRERERETVGWTESIN